MISELVRDTLTSYMVMGVMDKRDEFFGKNKRDKGSRRNKGGKG